MKVVHVIPELNVAGAEIMCENLCRSLKEKGIEVIIVSLFHEETIITKRLQRKGINVLFLDKKKGVDLKIIIQLKHLFDKEKPDVVHTHINALQYAFIAARLSRVKLVVHTVHSIAEKEATPLRQKLYWFIFRSNRIIPVALSEEIKNSIIKRYKLPSKRVPVIFNGINLGNCKPKNNYDDRGTLTFLHIGRFADVKNHEMLIDSFSEVYKDNPFSRLRLVGQGPNYGKVVDKVKEMGLSDQIEFCGLRADVFDLMHDADVFILPSLYEGMPMTLIEAMGTGLPIIASDVGGIPSMLTNGIDALLVSVTISDISDAMIKMKDSQLRKKMGESAKNRSLVFSSDIMADKYISIYQS